MLRRMLALLMFLLMLPVLAAADSPYQMFTFAESIPQRLEEPLAGYLPADSRIISGAAIDHAELGSMEDEPGTFASYSALLLVEQADSLHLIAAAWVDSLPWQMNDFTHLLRRDENVSISIYQPEPNRIPLFSVDYPMDVGKISDLMLLRGNRLWHLAGHINEAAGVSISIGLDSITVIDPQGRDMYVYAEGFWMEYMDDISAVPVSRAEVETLDTAAESIFVSNTAAGRAYTQGANLRQEATQSSASLGMYHTGTPLTLLGDQVQGKQYPWLHVRIGHTEGWMSRNYIIEQVAQDYPVPMGRTVDGCSMYAAPGDAQPIAQLSPGTTFHILTKIDGLYHICIPQGEISWDVDRNGTYGYIPANGILTGPGVSALDALDSTR